MNRNLYNKINQLLDMFPVVAVLGARQAGKTTLAKHLRPDWLYVDLERPSDFNRISEDPEFFLKQNPRHVIVDEAQISPELFNVLRGAIDSNRQEKGRYLITGSSSPELVTNISESLAGRIATVELGTFKTNELFGKPLSDFYTWFEQPLSKETVALSTKPHYTLTELQTAWLKGGYPEPVLSDSEIYHAQWMENYESNYIYRDIVKLYPRLNKVAYQRFLSMLCKLSSTILKKSDLGRALEVSEGSVREYLMIAEGTHLWRALPSYEHSLTKSIVKMPKGYIRDTGLLHSLLRITSQEQLHRDPIVGQSFEGFIIEEIIKGLQSTMLTHWDYSYYRTRAGAEIDLILEGPFGTLPIEIKYGTTVHHKHLRHLKNFVIDHNLPFGLLINQSDQPCWLSEHIFQLPANYL